MAKVRAALIQAHANMPKEEAIKKHEELIGEAAAKGAQITCLQEIFFGPCFWEKFYFKPGNLGYPVWDTSVGRVGILICYDRHFPEPARALGLKGAELVFNPSATVKSLSRYLWELEQPAHAVANGYWIGAINRVGIEKPLNEAQFYGSSYFCDPRGRIIGKASETEDEVLVCDLDLDMNREVRNTWQFLRDRRPESYEELVRELP